MSNHTNGENPHNKYYDKTEGMERVESKKSDNYGKEFTPPPKKQKTTNAIQG